MSSERTLQSLGLDANKKLLSEMKALAIKAKDYYYNKSKNLALDTKTLSDPACELLFGHTLRRGKVVDLEHTTINVPRKLEITDKIYDLVETFLKENGVELEARAPATGAMKKFEVDLPFDLPSLDKAKPGNGGLAKWLKANPCEYYMVSPKMDGLTLEVVFDNGKISVYTGTEVERGKDVSFLAPYLGLPKAITGYLAVRGEGIISKANFEQWSKKYVDPRNLASGIFNKAGVHEAIRHVDFVVYEVLSPRGTPSIQLKKLKTLGFGSPSCHTIDFKLVSKEDISEEYLAALYKKWKPKLAHEIDGLVVTVDIKTAAPKGVRYAKQSIAFKVDSEDQEVEATVDHIEWTPSKYGILAPVGVIKPVKIGRVTVSRVTLHNAKEVHDKSIGPGAKLLVIRSGEVIPYVKRVLKPASAPQMPDKKIFGSYAWDENRVQLVLKNRKDNDVAMVKALYSFLAKGLGVEHLAEATIAKCYAQGMTHINDYLKASAQDFMRVEGIQATKANKFVDQIQTAIAAADINKVAAYSGYFGRNFGSSRMALITAKYDLDVLEKMPDTKIDLLIQGIEGFSMLLAKQFVEHLHKFIRAKAKWPIKYKKAEKPKAKGSKMAGQQVVFTGFRDAVLEAFVTSQGGAVGSGVTGKTTILVVKDSSFTSNKVDAARAKGVAVYTRDQFINKFKP